METCRGIFVEERAWTLLETLSQKDAIWNSVSQFFPGIGITRLGVSFYPTAFLSNKLAYFVQFQGKNTPSLTEFWFTHFQIFI
jgi:hypothetical protein